jgi:hypothetical protein
MPHAHNCQPPRQASTEFGVFGEKLLGQMREIRGLKRLRHKPDRQPIALVSLVACLITPSRVCLPLCGAKMPRAGDRGEPGED